MPLNNVLRARTEFIVTHFLAFDAVDVRHSFMVGDRNYMGKSDAGEYRKHVFPLVVNLFTDGISDKAKENEACIFFIDRLLAYGKLLLKLNAPDMPGIIGTTEKLEKYMRSLSATYGAARLFWNHLASCGGAPHYFDCGGDLDLDKDISRIWDADFPSLTRIFGAAISDLNAAMRDYGALIEKADNHKKMIPIATPNQLMSGIKEFMTHTGVAACFALLRGGRHGQIKERMAEESIFTKDQLNDPELFGRLIERNIKSSKKHLECIIIDYIKNTVLICMEIYKMTRKPVIPWKFMKEVIAARHREHRGLGQGFLYRNNLYIHLLGCVVDLLDIPRAKVGLLNIPPPPESAS